MRDTGAMMTNDPNRPLRIGIVGAGRWAAKAHVPGFLACPGARLVALCDVDRDRAERVAAAAGLPRAYASAGEMLDQEALDLISIVTPDDAHVDPATLALERGLHVLCEKPLAASLDGARALAGLAERAGSATRVGFTMRFAPAMARLRALVAAGEVGAPHLIQVFQQNGQFLDPATPFGWKMDGERTGGGAVVEYGVHALDLARWIGGEVAAVSATSRTLVPSRPLPEGGTRPVLVDDSTLWLMELAGGAIGVGHAGWATAGRPPGVEVRVFGAAGAIRCLLSDELPGTEGLWRAGPDGAFAPVPLDPPESQDPWSVRFPALLIRAFVDGIRSGAVAGPTFADGLRAQELLAAVQRSARERRWVAVERG